MKLDKHQDTLVECQYSHDGECVITAGLTSELHVWSAKDGSHLRSLKLQDDDGNLVNPSSVIRLAVHQDHPQIAATCHQEDKALYLWDIQTGVMTTCLSGKDAMLTWPGTVEELDFGHLNYGHICVTVLCQKAKKYRNGSHVKVWDITTGQPIANIRGDVHTDAEGVLNLRMGRGNLQNLFLTGSSGGNAKLNDLNSMQVVQSYATPKADINMLTFSPCGQYVTSAGEDDRIYVFDRRAPNNWVYRLVHSEVVPPRVESGIAATLWTRFGSILISGGEDYTIKFWDIRLGTPLIHSMVTNSIPVALGLSPDDEILASGNLDGSVGLYAQKSSSVDSFGVSKFKLNQLLASEISTLS